MGTQHGFLMNFTPFFQIYRLFIFRYYSEKWTLSLKFGLLEVQESKYS